MKEQIIRYVDITFFTENYIVCQIDVNSKHSKETGAYKIKELEDTVLSINPH